MRRLMPTGLVSFRSSIEVDSLYSRSTCSCRRYLCDILAVVIPFANFSQPLLSSIVSTHGGFEESVPWVVGAARGNLRDVQGKKSARTATAGLYLPRVPRRYAWYHHPA